MASNPDTEPWKWLFGGRYQGLTLTFTRGHTTDGLLERYGADPSGVRSLPFADISAVLPPRPETAILRVGILGEWAFGIEDLGGQGAAEATLARLSHGTETISVHRGASAFEVFGHWAEGRPREQFEPGMASTLRAAGPHPFWDAAERHRAARPGPWDILAVMRAIGGRLAEETDDGPLPSVYLPQVLPPLPSPEPPLALVNPAANHGERGRRLATGLRVRDEAPLQPRLTAPAEYHGALGSRLPPPDTSPGQDARLD